jgi:hypothetical protein
MERLMNESRATGEAFNPLLARYVGFRLLHRLSVSPHRERYLVKGATMFLFWTGSLHRPTKDIDLLGLAEQDDEKAVATFRELCSIPCPTDGVVFDPETVRAEPIGEEQAYGGLRVALVGYVGNAKVPLQIDVGFGDVVTPAAQEVELPSILRDVPATRLKGYPVESAIAEKFQAIAVLGLVNSRMKDFFDIAYLASTMTFEAVTLQEAIRETFRRRSTPLPNRLPLALTDAFYGDQQVKARWAAFVRKNRIRPPFEDLPAVVGTIERLVRPLLELPQAERSPTTTWSNGKWN